MVCIDWVSFNMMYMYIDFLKVYYRKLYTDTIHVIVTNMDKIHIGIADTNYLRERIEFSVHTFSLTIAFICNCTAFIKCYSYADICMLVLWTRELLEIG